MMNPILAAPGLPLSAGVDTPLEQRVADRVAAGLSPAAPHAVPDLGPLQTAHDRTVDALAGFEVMVDKAEPQFRPVAQRFADLHRRHAAELAAMLVDLGAVPDTDGTLMGTVNRAVVSLRALFDQIDADAMDRIRSGEEHVCSAYQDALASGLPGTAQTRLAALLAELNDLLADTSDLG